MSTRRIMFRRRPGRFALAGLPGALLILLCLLPSTAFARANGEMGAHSLSSELNTVSAVINKAGVSVVRVSATYSASGRAPTTCTGLGVLVASQMITPQKYTNWVLTDGNLISSKMSVCGQLKGQDLTLSALNIWASSEYAGAKIVPLATLSCKELPLAKVSCGENGLFTDPIDTSSAAYTLAPFQSSMGEPYLELAPPASSASVSIGLIKSAGGGGPYPSKTLVAGVSETDFLTPSVLSSPPGATVGNGATPQATAPQSNKSIEGGTPELNDQGQLVGMWVNNGIGGYASLPLADISAALRTHDLLPLTPATSTQNCTVASCWLRGINEYNQGPGHYSTAHPYLQQAFALNKSFVAAQTFDMLTRQSNSPRGSSGNGNPPSAANLLGQYATLLLVVGAVVVLILLVVVVLVVRARIHRRKQAVMENEWKIARQTAEQEVFQKKAQVIASPPPPLPQAPQRPAPYCPNCRHPVQVTDSICPNCRFPLAPTVSGLGVRLMGNAPVGPSPLPPQATAPLSSITGPPQREAQPVLLQNAKPVQNPALLAVARRNCPRCGQVVGADTIDCPACHYHLAPVVQTSVQTEGVLTPVAENRTALQFAQSAQSRDTGMESEPEYAVAEERLRNLWNRVG